MSSRHSSLQQRVNQSRDRRPSNASQAQSAHGGSALQQSRRSLQSMGQDAAGALPDINQRGSSAKKSDVARSQASKGGPVKAFHDGSRSQASGHRRGSSKLSETMPKGGTLEPLADAIIAGSQGGRHVTKRSSGRISDKQQNFELLAESGIQIKSQLASQDALNKTGSEEAEINLDLHQVAIADANAIMHKSTSSLAADMEAQIQMSNQQSRKIKALITEENAAAREAPSNIPLKKVSSNAFMATKPDATGMSSNAGSALKSTPHTPTEAKSATIKRPKRVNQFKLNKMSQTQIINYLFEQCNNPVHINMRLKPNDLCSTSDIDSLLNAIVLVSEKNVQKKDAKFMDNLHLSTGTRTPFCHEVLNFLIKHQSRENMFIDAVEFFQEALEHMVTLENNNADLQDQLTKVSQEKQELTMKSFDLQHKLQDQSRALLKLRQKEYEQSVAFAETTQHLEAKRAECETLHFRLRMQNSMVGGNSSSGGLKEKVKDSPDAVKEGEIEKGQNTLMGTVTSEKRQVEEGGSSSKLDAMKITDDDEKPKDKIEEIQDVLAKQVEEFQAKNAKEENVAGLTQAASAPAQTSHGNLSRMQRALNQAQIDYKNLTAKNNVIKQRLSSKDRLVTHLENKVTQIMLENEEVVLKLQSQIVKLQSTVNTNDDIMAKKLAEIKEKLVQESEGDRQKNINKLEDTTNKTLRENGLLQQRIDKLLTDYDTLKGEFETYRSEKDRQEQTRDKYVNEMENKLSSMSKNMVTTKEGLDQKNKNLENKTLQKVKENEILLLRLKYLRQTADVLLRQKSFLQETLVKSKHELIHKMTQLESSMLSENKNKSYLVSVEKAVKQARTVAEISNSALQNIQQIVKFFKIEKMHSLIFESDDANLEEEMEAYASNDTTNLNSATNIDEQMSQGSDVASDDGRQYNLNQIQGLMNELKETIDLPVNFKPKQQEQERNGKAASRTVRDEEFYLENNPTELVSIMAKFLVELMMKLKVVESLETIPHSISRILYISSMKSNIPLEQDLFNSYFYESNKIITDELENMRGQSILISITRELANLYKNAKQAGKDLAGKPGGQMAGGRDSSVENESPDRSEQPRQMSMLRQSAVLREQQRAREAAGGEEHTLTYKQMQNELQVSKIKQTEQKEKFKELQKAMAERIVKLEESIDFLKEAQEDKLNKAEISYRTELENIKLGVIQRESQLLSTISALQSTNADLQNDRAHASQTSSPMRESAMRKRPAHRSKTALTQNNSQTSIDHGVRGSSINKIPPGSGSQNSEVELTTHLNGNYQENVDEFIRLREQTHSTISLVFESRDGDNPMVNEQLIAFYLSRVFELPKEKFRFIHTIKLAQESETRQIEKALQNLDTVHPGHVPVQIIKIIIEIIDDAQAIQDTLLQIKTEIRDGSSLLYDLIPSYMCINMGYSGLATSQKISDCHVISKQGRQINGQDFVLTILRSMKSAYSFIVTLLDLLSGENYCLELRDADIFQITEGNQGLLVDAEPTGLCDVIMDSLELIERDGVKFLTCEHKVFFNTLWQGILQSDMSLSSQQRGENNLEKNYNTRLADQTQAPSDYHFGSMRDRKILKGSYVNRLDSTGLYPTLLKGEAECQTEYEPSVLYDGLETIFASQEKLNPYVRIGMEVQQSMKENLITLQFTEARSGASAKFSVFSKNTNLPPTSDNSEMKSQEEVENLQLESKDSAMSKTKGTTQGHYLMHSECIQIQKDHLILLCVERVQQDGLLVKMHDLKMMNSSEFYLIKKSNGTFVKKELHQYPQICFKEEFRNLVFDLAFSQQMPTQEIIVQNISYAQDKMQAQGLNPQNVSQELFVAQAKIEEVAVNKVLSFTAEALLKRSKVESQHDEMQEWRGLQEKGLLLYRDTKILRCNKSSTDSDIVEEMEQQSLITIYLKHEQVNIEVFLYQDDQNLSITSNISSIELFGRDPLDLKFTDRVELLNQMLERLFVIQEDSRFLLKVEDYAEPMSHIIQQRAIAASMVTAEMTALRKNTTAQNEQQYEEKIHEIQLERSQMLRTGKARQFSNYITQDFHTFEVRILMTLRQKKASNKTAKRINTINKTQQQIEQQKIEKYIDEQGEVDQIYIETNSPMSEELIFTLIEKRNLAKILSKDLTCDWRRLLTFWGVELVKYIFKNIQVDLEKQEINIQSQQDVQDLLVSQCRSVCGSQILLRNDMTIVDGFDQTSNDLLRKTLVLNQEVDFTEHSYDIKLYKISRAPLAHTDSHELQQIQSYHLEIFNINQPDIVYKHRIPVQQSTTGTVHDPATFIVDVFNLHDHPLSDELAKQRAANADPVIQQQNSSLSGSNSPDPRKEDSTHQAPGDSANQQAPQNSTPNSSEMKGASRDKANSATDHQQSRTEEKADAHQVASTKYQLLFKKYIDNQLVLAIQETKFPASLSFTLLEPASRMVWKCSYEPVQEIVTPSTFSIVDPGTYEMFLTAIYDTLTEQSMITPCSDPQRSSGDWHNLPQDKSENLLNVEISDGIKLHVGKSLDKLRIYLTSTKEEGYDPLDHSGEVSAFVKELARSHTNHGVDLLIQKVRGVALVTKVLNADDSQSGMGLVRSKMLFVKVSVDKFTISVVDMAAMKCLFEYEFEHTNPAEDDIYMTPVTEVNPVHSVKDIKPFVLDAIKQLNNTHTQEQIVSNHAKMIDEKAKRVEGKPTEQIETFTFENVLSKVDFCAVHRQRFHQRAMNETKTITLHRKVVYDAAMEKLIIVTANLCYVQGVQKLDNPMLLEQDINQFSFKIHEPENNAVAILEVPLESCLTERQLLALNRRDLLKLKSVARMILEDRAVIRVRKIEQQIANEPDIELSMEIVPQSDDQLLMDMEGSGMDPEGQNDENLYIDNSNNMVLQEGENYDNDDMGGDGDEIRDQSQQPDDHEERRQNSVIVEEASQEEREMDVDTSMGDQRQRFSPGDTASKKHESRQSQRSSQLRGQDAAEPDAQK